MRLILFFDLPNVTNQERRIYNDFRKYLIKNGYIMIQFSVYSKIFNNKDAATNHVKLLKKNVPQNGHIRIMLVTEKQYSNAIIIIGGKSNQEQLLTIEPFLIL